MMLLCYSFWYVILSQLKKIAKAKQREYEQSPQYMLVNRIRRKVTVQSAVPPPGGFTENREPDENRMINMIYDELEGMLCRLFPSRFVV